MQWTRQDLAQLTGCFKHEKMRGLARRRQAAEGYRQFAQRRHHVFTATGSNFDDDDEDDGENRGETGDGGLTGREGIVEATYEWKDHHLAHPMFHPSPYTCIS